MNFKPGDLVMVVKPSPCCGNPLGVGLPFTVRGGSPLKFMKCDWCGWSGRSTNEILLSNGFFCSRDRLIKIDPLTEQEKTEATEEA